MSATLYGYFTQAIYRNRPIQPKTRNFKMRSMTWRAITARPYHLRSLARAALRASRDFCPLRLEALFFLGPAAAAAAAVRRCAIRRSALRQGLTLVHFSAQRKRFQINRVHLCI